MAEITSYGRVTILRAMCPECECMSIVRDGITLCHKRVVDTTVTSSKRVGDMQTKRKPMNAKAKQAVADSQGGLCFYCFNSFGSMYHRGSVVSYLFVTIDHQVPYSYLQADEAHNLVAACHICNMLKSNRMFDSVEDARVYVQAAWQRKKISIVS